MPDINVQDEKGTIHSFPDGSTPEMIAKAMGIKPPQQATIPTESQAFSNPAKAKQPLANNMYQKELVSGQDTLPETPRERIEGLGGQIQNRSITPMTNAVAAMEPVGAARAILGSKIAGYATKSLPPWAQAVAGLGGGLAGAVGPSMAEGISRATYEPPEKISLGPLGKINRNVPADPYEEMGGSAQYKQQAAAAGKPSKLPPSKMVLPWQQGSTSAPQDVSQLPPWQSSARPSASESTTTGPSAEIVPKGNPTPFPKPLTPLIGTPEEWAAHDQQMRILENEASNTGMYSAARGAIKKPRNYQERAGGKMVK